MTAARAIVFAVAAAAATRGVGQDAEAVPDGLRILPFGLLSEVRELDRMVDQQVQVYHGGTGDVRLLELVVRGRTGRVVARVPLDRTVRGDGGALARLYARLRETGLERCAPERRVPPGARREIARAVAQVARAKPRAFANVSFRCALREAFGPAARPGDVGTLELAVRYRRSGGERIVRGTHRVRLLAPYRRVRLPGLGPLGASVRFVACDLHVHHCRDEAIGGCPSCLAETQNLRASFTLRQLRSQYQALGLQAFASTSHSYCINSAAEYAGIARDAAALSDGSFVVLPDTELTSVEAGPQEGFDLTDLYCAVFGAGPTNHGGAHGISSRKPGGNDGLLQNCSPPCLPFPTNLAAIAGEGGFLVVHHPSSMLWGWNSFAATRGVEAGARGLHGVEIWNGRAMRGQGGHVGFWVRQLLAGRLLYAYSGSDTHDAAFDFGATHVLMTEALSQRSLVRALKSGRTYVSNGDFLVVGVSIGGGKLTAILGDITPFPRGLPRGVPLEVLVLYDLGARGSVTVFRGRWGDAAETVLQRASGLSGVGLLRVRDTLENATGSYYRAYAESDDGRRTAYTSPVFFVPR